MVHTVGEWLNTPLIIIAALAVGSAIFGVFVFVWKVSRWTSNVDGTLASLKESADRDRAAFTSVAKEVREDIKKILLYLSPRSPIESKSPYRLSEFGEEIATKLEARRWATQLAPPLMTEVEDMEPFEIDDFSREYVADRLSAEWRRQVAICAYEIGIERAHVEVVLAIVLRDELLWPDRLRRACGVTLAAWRGA